MLRPSHLIAPRSASSSQHRCHLSGFALVVPIPRIVLLLLLLRRSGLRHCLDRRFSGGKRRRWQGSGWRVGEVSKVARGCQGPWVIYEKIHGVRMKPVIASQAARG
eukprot:GHVU01005290.1.p1 GENE.GHVU01005290.1~~GHVU01005290.1.p1  ORF type:complete len:106 (+),score=0.77 GHVU01005290.1:170-487(+)